MYYGGAFEGVPVCSQDALRAADFALGASALAPLQVNLPGDCHVRLFLPASLEVHHQGIKTPAETSESKPGVLIDDSREQCNLTFNFEELRGIETPSLQDCHTRQNSTTAFESVQCDHTCFIICSIFS